MIKKFEEFIEEGRMSRILAAADNGEVRKQDGIKYHPDFLKDIDPDFYVYIPADYRESFEKVCRDIYDDADTMCDFCGFERTHDLKQYFPNDNVINIDEEDGHWKFHYKKYDEETWADFKMGENGKMIYDAVFKLFEHLLEDVCFDYHDRTEYFVIIEEREAYNIQCQIDTDKYGHYMLDDIVESIKPDLSNEMIKGCDITRDDYNYHSYNNYASSWELKAHDFDHLLWAGYLRRRWLDMYNDAMKSDDIVEYFGLNTED